MTTVITTFTTVSIFTTAVAGFGTGSKVGTTSIGNGRGWNLLRNSGGSLLGSGLFGGGFLCSGLLLLSRGLLSTGFLS